MNVVVVAGELEEAGGGVTTEEFEDGAVNDISPDTTLVIN